MPTLLVCAGGVAPPRNGVFRASNGKHHLRRTLSRLPGLNYQKRSHKLSYGGRTCASSADGGSLVNVDLPTKLNNVPHAREKRQWFYTDIAKAVKASFRAGESRTTVRLTIPETNTEQDVYRVGTILELVRWVATVLAQDGDRVKVCVQQSMGQGIFQGLPLSLSGVRQIMSRMDWGSIQEFVSFGQVGADQVDDSRFYILIAPQNVVGTTIMTNLEEMADDIRDRGKGLVLINPVLKDVPSAGGVMGVRGRKERMDFAASFLPVYHFRLLYWPGTAFPIMGGLRYTYGGTWEVYKREDLPGKNEQYRLAGSFPSEPDGGQITDAILKEPRAAKHPGQWW